MNVTKLDGHPIRTPMGANDVVTENGLVENVMAPSVLVTSGDDLEELPDYPAGTMAYTAGFKALWQLDASGEWVSML